MHIGYDLHVGGADLCGAAPCANTFTILLSTRMPVVWRPCTRAPNVTSRYILIYYINILYYYYIILYYIRRFRVVPGDLGVEIQMRAPGGECARALLGGARHSPRCAGSPHRGPKCPFSKEGKGVREGAPRRVLPVAAARPFSGPPHGLFLGLSLGRRAAFLWAFFGRRAAFLGGPRASGGIPAGSSNRPRFARGKGGREGVTGFGGGGRERE